MPIIVNRNREPRVWRTRINDKTVLTIRTHKGQGLKTVPLSDLPCEGFHVFPYQNPPSAHKDLIDSHGRKTGITTLTIFRIGSLTPPGWFCKQGSLAAPIPFTPALGEIFMGSSATKVWATSKGEGYLGYILYSSI